MTDRNQKPAGVGGLAAANGLDIQSQYITHSPVTQTLSRALEYVDHGLAVFPLPHGVKVDGRAWTTYRDAPPDQREIVGLFSGNPQNIAVIGGEPSGNLLTLDADNPAIYDEINGHLAGLGIYTWTVRRPPNGTPHDGGGAFILRTPEPMKTAKRGDLDVKAEGSYFIAPNSLHPGGTVYYDETPLPIFELPDLSALAWLNLQVAPDTPLFKLQDLSNKAWGILKGNPRWLAQYNCRHSAENALCCSLVRCGRTFDDALRLFRNNKCAGKFREKEVHNPETALKYLGGMFYSAERWVAGLGENEAGLMARRLKAWALSRPWRGRGASSERAVYIAHCDIVLRCGQQPHCASARELAEMAGVGRMTASKANIRLVKTGLLELERASTSILSHQWNLVEQIGAYVDTSLQEGIVICPPLHQNTHTSHDAFRYAGLNKSGAEIIAVMEARQESTVNELAETTGRHRTTVKRKLLQMHKVGLVEPLGDGLWQILDNFDLDQAARELHTSGAGRKQRQNHIRQRRAQARWATSSVVR